MGVERGNINDQQGSRKHFEVGGAAAKKGTFLMIIKIMRN